MRHVRMAVIESPHTTLVCVPTRSIRLVPHESFAVGISNAHCDVHSTFLLVGQLIIGGVVSTTVTVWLHCAVLPQPFMACQIRVAVNVPPQKPELFVIVEKTVMNPFLEDG